MNLIIKKITNFAFLFLLLFIISCSDEFETAIKTENNTAGTGGGKSNLPTVSFETSASYTLNENEIPHQINIILSRSFDKEVSIIVEDTVSGTATTDADYTFTGWDSSAIITFNPGETSKSVILTPVQDSTVESESETVILGITLLKNCNINNSSHIVTITDDDGWVKIGNIATPRAGAAVALEGDWLYIYGGETYSGVALDDFWRYNLSTEVYEILPISESDIPSAERARAYATLVNLNGILYLFGGRDSSGTVYDDKITYYYDTSSDSWSNFTNSETNNPWPAARSHHIAVPVYNAVGPIESIYFYGGKDSAGNNIGGDLFEIDLSVYKHDWLSYKIPPAYDQRSEHSAVFYNDSIYLFGGFYNGTYYNDLWSFDTISKSFSEIMLIGPTIIPARSGISMIEHNGRLYVFGGFDGTNCLDDLWYYSSGSWTKISSAPFKRAFYSAVKYNNSLIVFGGYYINASSQKVFTSEIWQYELE